MQFSHNLVNTLQNSTEVFVSPIPYFPFLSTHTQPQSDSTRAKETDLHIAQLVHSELSRLQAREDEILSAISRDADNGTGTLAPPPPSSDSTLGKLSALLPASLTGQDDSDDLNLSRQALAEKIEELKKRLAKVPAPGGEGEDGEVVAARQGVVQCLRFNDRRPLDCWAEVERFREVARRREREFVVGVVGREF